eukprot:TRINITY_DN2317_c0_g1_i1.p1 TRINITY_DN2317_c0_g1~~TRINITY_DN2317_c0_g1_i1.p1  ORF type:complete len:205 (-),score=45.60 TRINITY_DN2317_c0_g1_i1:24-638(-)
MFRFPTRFQGSLFSQPSSIPLGRRFAKTQIGILEEEGETARKLERTTHRTLVPLGSYRDPVGKSRKPKLAHRVCLAEDATLSGNVEVWEFANIWHGVTIRGDVNLVRIGAWTNIQDNCTISEAPGPLHEDHDGSTIVGHFVTVGHDCHLRACTIEDYCQVGMGSVLEEDSYMESKSILGANSVLTSGSRVPTGQVKILILVLIM